MPNKPVILHRWQVGAVLALVVLAAAGSAQWANHHTNARIDEAEQRITMNTQNISQARVRALVAEETARSASTLAAEQQHTIRVLCGEIKAVKAQIVETLRSSSGSAQQLVGRIPGYTQDDADRAEARLQQALARFAPRPCPPKGVD